MTYFNLIKPLISAKKNKNSEIQENKKVKE